jgi:hypothetical protein
MVLPLASDGTQRPLPLPPVGHLQWRDRTRRLEVEDMTTYATDRHDELADRERLAWAAYREGLRDLGGTEYELLEPLSWDELQRELAEVATERAALPVPDTAT